MLGGQFKQQKHQQNKTRTKEVKKKGHRADCKKNNHLFIQWELDLEGKSSPCLSSAGNVHVDTWVTKIYHHSDEVLWMTQGNINTDFGVPNEV